MNALAWFIGIVAAIILCFAMLSLFAMTPDLGEAKGLPAFLIWAIGLPILLLAVSSVMAPFGKRRTGKLLICTGIVAGVLTLLIWAMLSSGPGQQVLADDPNGSLAQDFAAGNFNFILGFGSMGLSILLGYVLLTLDRTSKL